MPSSCCAPHCKSNYDVKGPSVRVYKFPRDPKQRAAWTKAVARENFTPTMHSVLCEKHFLPSDFIRTTMRTDALTGKVIEVQLEKLRLKQSAVPSVFPSYPNISRPTTSTGKAHRDEKTLLGEDQQNKAMTEHPVYECRNTTAHISSSKKVQTDLASTVEVAVGPSHGVCRVSSSTQALTVTLDRGTQTCPSNFNDPPDSLAKPRLQGFSCERCKRLFYTQDILDAHQCSQMGRRSSRTMRTCTYCPYSSASKSAIVSHERKHTGERPYVCQYCQKSFAQEPTLRKHLLRIHTIGGRYKCSECGASFFRRASHNKHVLSHRSEKPHACSQCGKGFRTRYQARRHERNMHPVKVLQPTIV